MLHRLAVLALELAAGSLVWLLIRRSAVMGPAPAWVRLYAGFVAALFLGAAGVSLFGMEAVFERLPENLIVGYGFAEILVLSSPENRARWRRLKKALLGGHNGHFPGYYE